MRLSVLVPTYNEARTLAEVIRRVRDRAPAGVDLEVIVIDDGSVDATAAVAESCDPPVVLLRHDRNRGKGAALRTGLARAGGDVVIVQDADLEYDPADWAPILSRIASGARVVYGSRILGGNPRSYRRYDWGGRFLTFVFNALYRTRLTDITTCSKAFVRDAIAGVPLTCDRFEFCVEITARLVRRGERIVEVPITYRPRSMEEGKKIRWHDGLSALWVIVRMLRSRP